MRLTPDSVVLIKRILLFAVLLMWCAALLLCRYIHSGSLAFGFLVWNLFLAAIPVLAAWLFVQAVNRRAALVVQAGWFALWLVFLPNAPYIVTDFVHLEARPPVPLWYDIALLGSFAGTGVLLGYSSLGDVQMIVTRKFSAVLGWVVSFAALLLCGFGIYLGRFQRWNSWDALANPIGLCFDIASRAANPASHPRTVVFTLIYGTGLLLGYVALQVAHISAEPRRGRFTVDG